MGLNIKHPSSGPQVEEGPAKEKAAYDGTLTGVEEPEPWLHALATESGLAVFLLQKWKFVYVNPTFTAVTGYALSDLYTLRLSRIVGIDEASRQQWIAMLRKPKTNERHSIRFLTKLGQERILSVGLTPVALGGKSALLGSFIDVTEYPSAQEALQMSERRYRAIFDNAMEGIYQTTADGRYIDANQSCARMFGYADPKVLMSEVTDIARQIYVDPAERQEIQRILEEADRIEGREVQVFRRDGQKIWISLNMRPVRNSAGTVLYYEGTNQDITERKRAEERLRRQNMLIESMIKNIPVDFWVRNREERVVLQSDASAAIWGSLIGTATAESGVGDANQGLWDANNKQALAGKVVQGETRYVHEGKERIVHSIVAPVRSGNEIQGTIGINIDVTDQKQAEAIIRESYKTLEKEVAKRTAQLTKSKEEVESKTRALQELNTALRVLLRQRDHDRKDLEARFISNVKELVLPYIEKAVKGPLTPQQAVCLGIAEANLREIISPFLRTVRKLNLTPKEISVASLIKDGRTTKEIAEIMGIATSAVDSHRNNIRNKLGLRSRKVRLQSFLHSLT